MRKRDIIGRTIVAYEPRWFRDGRGGRAKDPMLRLDNGAILYFNVRETEIGEYGIDIGIAKPKRKK